MMFAVSQRGKPLHLLAVLATLASVGYEGVAEETTSKSSDILEVMAWCKGIQEGLDWQQVLRVAKSSCFENEEEDAVLRIKCSDEAMVHIIEATRILLDLSTERSFACANGLVFVLAVSLTYGRDAFSSRDAARAQVMLWGALQENFLMDASIWPVKTHDVLELFHAFPPALSFDQLDLANVPPLDAVTFLVPRCTSAVRAALLRKFPKAKVFAGLRDGEAVPKKWKKFEGWHKPAGATLNEMLNEVKTPLSLVVVGSGLPREVEDIERMIHVITNRRVFAVGGPIVDAERVYSDFCHRLQVRHYKLSFDGTYEHSVIFDEGSAASVRGSWFREEHPNMKEGPCKLCDTLPPTFMARTDELYALRFQPPLDGEWALIDLSLRATRAPLAEVRRAKEADASSQPMGWKHGAPSLALCPFVSIREEEVAPAATAANPVALPHLYGRRDVPRSGVVASMAWFGSDGVALGAASGDEPGAPKYLKPAEQFKTFMELNHLREFRGPDGVTQYSGSTLGGANCPVPNWVYRGWAAPSCCKETMRHLLFYISDVFRELGIRFIVTDGVLLGSYKFGGMLDWDADVDLHIHDDDFHRLADEVKPRVAKDGHYLRLHENNNSWLLQANEQNYLLIELNKRSEAWDPDSVWQLPIEGRLFPAMEEAHLNLSSWYGMSFFQHRLRHVPEWEEALRPMYCATPYHYNCVDETQVPGGHDCRRAGVC